MEKETYEPKEDWFHNKNSYKAFMYAVELVQKLKDLQKQGYLLLDDSALLIGEWVVVSRPEDSTVGLRDGNCTHLYVGSQWDSRTGKTYCTLKEVKEAFSKVRCIHPTHIKKVS